MHKQSIKKTAARLNPKTFVRNHPNITLGVVAGLTALVVAQNGARKQWDEFMESKGIDLDEYYCPEYFAEKNNA